MARPSHQQTKYLLRPRITFQRHGLALNTCRVSRQKGRYFLRPRPHAPAQPTKRASKKKKARNVAAPAPAPAPANLSEVKRSPSPVPIVDNHFGGLPFGPEPGREFVLAFSNGVLAEAGDIEPPVGLLAFQARRELSVAVKVKAEEDEDEDVKPLVGIPWLGETPGDEGDVTPPVGLLY